MSRVSQNISENIILNPTYNEILNFIAIFPDNSSGLNKRGINKAQSVIYRQLNKLNKENYIISFDGKRNAYTINYKKILSDFYDFFKTKILNEYELSKNSFTIINNQKVPIQKVNKKLIYTKKEIDFESIIKDIKSKNFEKEFINNSIFEIHFICILRKFNNKTLYEIFNILFNYYIEVDIYDLYLNRLEFFKKKNISDYLDLLILNNKELGFHFYFIDIIQNFNNKSTNDILMDIFAHTFEDKYIE